MGVLRSCFLDAVTRRAAALILHRLKSINQYAEPASMFKANAKLPKTMGLVSTLLHFPRINFIHLHCSYQKGKAIACCCLHWKYYMPKGSAVKTVFLC